MLEINKNEIKWDKKHHKPKKIKETICRNKSEKIKKKNMQRDMKTLAVKIHDVKLCHYGLIQTKIAPYQKR